MEPFAQASVFLTMIKRRRCDRCRLMTYKWQKINGGPWHCYDGCMSTTGVDHRSSKIQDLVNTLKEGAERVFGTPATVTMRKNGRKAKTNT